jgi:hypothetical protein
MVSPASPTTCVAWSRSGDALAVGSLRNAFLWTRTGARVLKNTNRAPLYALAFSPAGDTLACGSESKTTKLVSCGGKAVASLSGDSGAVTHVSFDPRGERVLAGRALWTTGGEALARKRFSMISTFVDDGTILSAGPVYEEDLVRPALYWMTPEGEVTRKVPLAAPARHIATDGEHVAVSDGGPRISIFDARGERLGDFERHKSGHMVSGLAISGARVASGGFGDTDIWVTDFAGAQAVRLPGYARPTQHNGIAFAPHAPQLVAALGGALAPGGGGDCIWLHDVESGRRVRLYAADKAWLAVDDGGRYMGAAALADDAKQEDTSLLDALFA